MAHQHLERARATGNGRIEASTLSALATILVEQGRVDDAIPMLKESLRIHGRLGDLLDTEVALCRAAHVLAVEGRAQAAAQLLAAFEAAGERVGNRRDQEAEMNAATLRAIRTQLDRDAFEDAWAKGRALSIDEALALALDWLG